MILAQLVFYLLAVVTVAAAVMVISAKNPVHSVLFLILAFFNSAGLFILLGAEFIGMLLVVVYVGAVAVLFLFVVMMLDINFVQLREGFLQYLPVGALVGLILLVELGLVFGSLATEPALGPGAATTAQQAGMSNTEAIGRLLYTDYFYLFQAAGIILLVAMIGAMALTMRHRPDAKRQNIGRQVGRRRSETLEIRKVPPRSGI
jgi:NADH:ubiquinone oxidoreductase subunit 6 (chain J)